MIGRMRRAVVEHVGEVGGDARGRAVDWPRDDRDDAAVDAIDGYGAFRLCERVRHVDRERYRRRKGEKRILAKLTCHGSGTLCRHRPAL
jgi:hypothetical protein